MAKSNKSYSFWGPCLTIIIFIIIIWWIIYYLYKNKFFRSDQRDLFQNMSGGTLQNAGKYPFFDLNPLLIGFYPLTGRKSVSNDDYQKIWWTYPVLPLGSFEQVTNNLKYRYNPDDGQCITADFCGAIYKDKKVPSNVAKMLPPVASGKGARVNYYRNKDNFLL